MNRTVETFTREKIKEGLSQLPKDWQHTFRRMYSPGNLTLPIAEVVDQMPVEKLDWALTQVENSLLKERLI